MWPPTSGGNLEHRGRESMTPDLHQMSFSETSFTYWNVSEKFAKMEKNVIHLSFFNNVNVFCWTEWWIYFDRMGWLKLEAKATSISSSPERDRQSDRGEGPRKNEQREVQVWPWETAPVWWDIIPWPFTLAVQPPNTQDKCCEWTYRSPGINQLKSGVSVNLKCSLYEQLNFCKSDVRASLKGTLSWAL